MFAQRRKRLTTQFSERIPVVKRRISVMCEMLNNDYNCGFSPTFGISNPLRLQKLLHQLCANTTNSAQTLNYLKMWQKRVRNPNLH